MSDGIGLFRYSNGVQELIGKKIKSVFFPNYQNAVMIVTEDMQLFKIVVEIGYDNDVDMFFDLTDEHDVRSNLNSLFNEKLISLEQRDHIISHYERKQKEESERREAELSEMEYQIYTTLKAKFEPESK